VSTDRVAALRACWHPVAYATDVACAPHATTLLGEPLVLWRDTHGDVHAFRDVCVHRGTALSLGCVEGDEIVVGRRMALTISCDHRVMDGAMGASFLQDVKRRLEEPLRLLV
jgi:nitrite reductase/ring-hydroxylating ferredoxin subunit